MSYSPLHYMVTMQDKNGGPDQAFWIDSHSEHGAKVKASRICGPGYTAIGVEPLSEKKSVKTLVSETAGDFSSAC